MCSAHDPEVKDVQSKGVKSIGENIYICKNFFLYDMPILCGSFLCGPRCQDHD